MEDEMADLYGDCKLLAGLSPEDVRMFHDRFSTALFGAGQIIFSEGDTSRAAYIVLEGQMGVRSHFLEEWSGIVPFRSIIAKMGPGEIIGEFALLDARPRSAEVYAMTDARVLVIDQGQFEAFSREHPHIGYAIMRNLALILIDRMRQTNMKLKAALEWGWEASKIDRE